MVGAALACLASASRADDFFAGKTITVSTHSASGGQYDRYLRTLQRFFGKYVPGNPSIVVFNQVGAGGLLAVNHAAQNAPRDGTFLTLVANGLLLFQGIGQPGLRASLGDFKWVGNFSASNGVTVAWATAGVRDIADARKKELVIGSSGAGSVSALLPAAHNALAGTRFTVVQGYEGAAAMNLAIRRGELQGRSGSTWSDFISDFPRETADGTLIPLTQTGQARESRLPNVPLLSEVVGDDPNKIAAARFVGDALTQNRSLAAPPGTPDATIAILRAAFERTIADPEFQAAAELGGLELSPTTGETVEKAVRAVVDAPASVRDTARAALAVQRD
jgi:tripartite-type tricarboxylate transporter receptor subunit TctC